MLTGSSTCAMGSSWTACLPTEMRSVWRVLARILFWSFERGTWPYDLLVAAILLFVFLAPRHWFHDQPRIGPALQAAQVQLFAQDPSSQVNTYRVDAHLLAPPKRTPELERETHEILRKNVDELKGRTFQVVRIEAVRGDDGAVLYYDVSVKK